MPGKHFDLDTNTSLGGTNSSDITIASQKAIKTYVDAVAAGSAKPSDIPTKTSQLINDSDFINGTELETELAKKADTKHTHTTSEITDLEIPTKTSQLTNDSGFITDISGKQDKIDSTHKLSADLVEDGTTNKVVTETEKTTWSGKQDLITDLADIRTGASAGSTALQPKDNVSELTNDAGYLTTVSWNTVTDKPTKFTPEAHEHTSSEITDLSTTIDTAISGKANKATTLDGYGITDAYTKTEIDGKLTGAMRFKGTVNKVSDLPTSGNQVGDMYNVKSTGANYAWDGESWDKLSESIDLSGLQTKITSTNKLSADLVDDSTTTNKFVTDTDKTTWSGKQDAITSSNKLSADLLSEGETNKLVSSTEKTTWNAKQDAISDLATIRSGAEDGAEAATTISGYGDIVTHNASEFVTDISGLQPKITSTNKLSADLIEDGTTNKTVTQAEKDVWNGKQSTITDLDNIRTGAEDGTAAVTEIATYGDVVTQNTTDVLTIFRDWTVS